MVKTEEFTTSNDINHISKDGKTLIVSEKIEKRWIKLPKQLGEKRVDIKESFKVICVCKKHITRLYILDCEYMTMYCDENGWAWLRKFNDKDLKEMKEKCAEYND